MLRAAVTPSSYFFVENMIGRLVRSVAWGVARVVDTGAGAYGRGRSTVQFVDAQRQIATDWLAVYKGNRLQPAP
jgi:hypothetical protein